MQIDLVYFEGCPHVADARQRLRDALALVDSPTGWCEWDTHAVATPEHLRGYASPTVLVNGVDVEAKVRTSGAGCSVGGGPDLSAMQQAIEAARR